MTQFLESRVSLTSLKSSIPYLTGWRSCTVYRSRCVTSNSDTLTISCGESTPNWICLLRTERNAVQDSQCLVSSKARENSVFGGQQDSLAIGSTMPGVGIQEVVNVQCLRGG